MIATNLNNSQTREFVWKIDTKAKNRNAKKSKKAQAILPILKETELPQTDENKSTETEPNSLEHTKLHHMIQLLLDKVTYLEQNIKVLRAEHAALYHTLKAMQQEIQQARDTQAYGALLTNF